MTSTSVAPDRAPAPPRGRKTFVVLALALSLGLGVAFLVSQAFGSRPSAPEPGPVNTVQVLVAKKNLAKGDALTKESVAVREVPKAFVQSQGLAPAAFEQIEGRKLAYPLKPGDLVLKGLLQHVQEDSFSAKVEPGRRAITIPVDEINSISGLLEPGDRVDLVAHGRALAADGSAPSVLLQSVRVMATGQKLVDDPKTGESRRFSTVTLDLTVDEATRLIQAREGGKLTALLRNRADTQKLAEAPRPAKPAPAPRPVAQAPAHTQVPVIYGGSGAAAANVAALNSK